MRFAFSEEDRLASGAVRALLERELPATAVRAAWSDQAARPSPVWKRLAEQGVMGLTLPAAHGGMEQDELSLVGILEECGRAALPGTLLETTAVGGPLLASLAGRDARAAGWLSRAAAGEGIITVGLHERALVPDADIADVVILARGGALYALTPAELTLTSQRSVDGARKLFSVAPAAGGFEGAARLADGELARDALALALDRGAVGAAAMLLGLGARALELTAAHVKVRTQFGAPIGSFQAVKHHLASAHLALSFARPTVYRAAYALAKHGHDAAADAVVDRARWVSLAKAQTGDAVAQAGRAALQCHGAIGYSFEHDLHLYLKRAWALSASYGDAAFHRARLGTLILDRIEK